ncbi:MAG: GNAT family N-acetyltransferase [Pseudomonadota bacterium]
MKELGYDIEEDLLSLKLAEVFNDDSDQVFVAELDNRLVGVVSCHVMNLFHQKGKLGRVTSFIVASKFQGKGVGTALLYAAEEFFQISGCVRSEVTSGEHRDSAHSFYRSRGFIEDERRFVKAYS